MAENKDGILLGGLSPAQRQELNAKYGMPCRAAFQPWTSYFSFLCGAKDIWGMLFFLEAAGALLVEAAEHVKTLQAEVHAAAAPTTTTERPEPGAMIQ